MTVIGTSTKITYAGNGSTTVWSFSFAVTATGDIQVFIVDPTGNITQLPTNAYTVVLNTPIDPNPTPVGGVVNYPLAGPPLAIGNSITLIRVLPETQTASISNQSIVYPPVVEQTFDRLVMIDQQMSEVNSRAVVVSIVDPPMAPLPPAAARANLQAIFDSSGNLTGGTTPAGVTISAAMIPVVTASTLTAAQTAMGVPPIASPVFTGNPTAPTPAPGDNDQSLATTAFVQAALVALGSIFSTGDLKSTHKTVADPGWILWIDGTIGDATSGSSVRANADTSALFILYYNGYSDGNCPLLTSTGAATTRAVQGTAAAAFAAHCRMTLPKGSSRALGLAGTGAGLTGRVLGSTFGSETHTQTQSEMANHAHNSASGSNFMVNEGGGNVFDVTAGAGLVNYYTTTGFQGGGAPMNIMNPMTYINIMIKL